MKNKVSIIIIIMFALPLICNGQSLDDYLHTGSNLYINGQMKEAKAKILEGIQKYPNDQRLKALAEKIKEDEKKDNQKKDQDKKEEDKKDQNKDQQNQDQQDKKDQQQQQQPQISKEDAERLLQALANDEKKTQEKLKEEKAKAAKARVVKEW
ncbi:MAG: hypothetical protein RBT49_05660 [Bacteroidales bacterium]|nr:hypothetical protein [Bacteroidales bacterium]